jgi:5-methylcytosine-specific restriction endonuclease McrA
MDIPALTKEYTTPEISHNLRTSFLPLIPELEMVVGLVAEAADALIAGDRNLAYARLCQANLPTVRTYAARIICQTDPLVHRYPLIRHPKERQIRTPRPTESVKAKIYARDGCRCRYCGVRVIVPKAITVLANMFPELPELRTVSAEQHAAFFAMKAVVDHVIPWSVGGRNDESNLVTSCQCCNYGKWTYLIDEIDFIDPWTRPPVRDEWDGLDRLRRWRPERR